MASRYEKAESKKRILSTCVRLFIEKGYSKTALTEILKEANVTPSTFYNLYRTKGGVLTELTEFMFENQFNIAELIVGENANPALLYAVETSIQLTLAELNENLREIYVEAYTSPENVDIIHRKTAAKLQKLFHGYSIGYSESDFYETEIGTSGVMRAFMVRRCDIYFTLERKLSRFLKIELSVFEVSKDEIQEIIDRILSLDICSIANRVMQKLFKALEMKFDFTLTNTEVTQ